MAGAGYGRFDRALDGAVVVDGHTDTPSRLFHQPADLSVRLPDGHVDLPRLREGGVTVANARAASAGWGGDRLALLRGPGGAIAVALLTTWDTAADADEFAAAARLAVEQLPLGGSVVHAAGSSAVSIGIGVNAAAIVAALGGQG